MIVSHTHKFVFVKTRKVAGTSIEYALSKHLCDNDVHTGFTSPSLPTLSPKNIKGKNLSHMGWNKIQQKFPEAWKEYFTFSIERNPWDKVVSYYFWYKNRKPETTANGFESWLKNHIHILSDWSKYAKEDTIMVDKIIPYENLKQELTFLHNENNIPNVDIDTITLYSNFRQNEDYKQMYNKKTKKLVEIFFEKEIEYFKYEF